MQETTVVAQIMKLLPLLIPLLLVQIGLLIAGVVDLVKREKTKGPKWMWVLIIVFVNIIGPIIYFVVGREEE